MVIFVIAIVVFIIIMFLVYMISLPNQADYSDFKTIFFFLAIFEFIVAAILFCSVFLYVKKLRALN